MYAGPDKLPRYINFTCIKVRISKTHFSDICESDSCQDESNDAVETMSAKLRNKLQEAKRNFDSNARKSLDFNQKAAGKTDSEQNEAVKKDEAERVADLLRQNNVISVVKF